MITRGFGTESLITRGLLGSYIPTVVWKEIKNFIVYIKNTVSFNTKL